MLKQLLLIWTLLATSAAVECPDKGNCDEGQTCCSSPNNGYQCCSFEQAECCEDHIHCCPSNTVCDQSSSSCINATVSIPWMERTSAAHPTTETSFWVDWLRTKQGNQKDNNVSCSETSSCPDGCTCCMNPTQEWACCPLPQAVCCDDHIHCCPHGKRCNLEQQRCETGQESVPWVEKIPAIQRKDVEVKDVQCDQTAACPDGTTCCKTLDGEWGCCPFPQAVCCDDHLHCCPHGKRCNLEQQRCETGQESVPWFEKILAIQRKNVEVKDLEVKDVQCDQTTYCPDGSTCCKMLDGEWGCCPLPQAVCCDDHLHCCPHGQRCDHVTQNCYTDLESVPWFEKIPAIQRKNVEVKDVQCDSTAACPDGTTCCKTLDGEWGCCPFPQAVCCEDHLHCCPHGKRCNLEQQRCETGQESVPWFEKILAIQRKNVEVKNVQCDQTTYCPDGSTCCKMLDGDWWCCPLPEAVCCDDHLHCCPHGQRCNLEQQRCETGQESVPWFEKIPAIQRKNVEVKIVQCDQTTYCPDGSTCCKMLDGEWGCCPLPQAVCCDDHLHCCPHGQRCDHVTQNCYTGQESVPWFEKIPAIQRKIVEVKDVQCDSTAACPDGTTCCKTLDGEWGCCPFPQAVCCDDHLHCCPHGKRCNVEQQRCETGQESVPWFEKILAIQRKDMAVKDVSCDPTAACPDGTTCCKTLDGEWGCCPFPQAVCCDDHLHCCPHGQRCNLEQQKCETGQESVPWFEKIPAIQRKNVEVKDVQCDSTAACPDGTTCCKTLDGEWGCCPFPQAVCCDDHLHCCPHGQRCNLEQQKCETGQESVPWFEKIPAIQRKNVEVKNVEVKDVAVKYVPCDRSTACPDGSTCCTTPYGQWECCPLPQAVCCDDHRHCCPYGHRCNLTPLGCVSDLGSVPWFEKIPAIQMKDVEAEEDDGKMEAEVQPWIKCDANASCPPLTTCCFMEDFHKYGCCPLLKAVCCPGGMYCCPESYTCNTQTGKCVRGDEAIPWFSKRPVLTKAAVPTSQPGYRRCDETSQCSALSTCCRLPVGEWGCCPLQDAVCCSGSSSCCPKGYSCSEEGRCVQKARLDWAKWKMLLSDKKDPEFM